MSKESALRRSGQRAVGGPESIGLPEGSSGMHIVLVAPEIPQNTGSIARLCAGTGSILHLVEPLGFSLDDRYLKRAGLDYWGSVMLEVHLSFEEYLKLEQPARLFLFCARAPRVYTKQPFRRGDHLIFGCESKGLERSLLQRFSDRTLRIPLLPAVRSFNLANSVAEALFEALRQQGWDPGPHPGGFRAGKPTTPWKEGSG